MAARPNGITDAIAIRLATVATQAFYQVLSLQRPWGEFRELIPQSIETLASRGREAEQYRFGPKPKIFVSFDAIRTLSKVVDAMATPEADLINQRFIWAKKRFSEYIAISLLKGVDPPRGVRIEACRWFPDYAFGDVNDHSGLHELSRVPDIRHTAEGVHFLLEYGGCELDSLLISKADEDLTLQAQIAEHLSTPAIASTNVRQLIESIILVVNNKAEDNKYKFDSLSIIAVAHILNLFAYAARLGIQGDLALKIVQARDKLAHRIATDNHRRDTSLWITDSLGDVWGASFLMHLFDCGPVTQALRDCWVEARDTISTRLDRGLVYPTNDDKVFETNIQALLALCKAKLVNEPFASLSPPQFKLLSRLVSDNGILHIASMEIGEACQLVQLSLLLARRETLDSIASSKNLLKDSIRVHISALSEQLNYGYLSEYRAARLESAGAVDAKRAYDNVVEDVIGRCELIRSKIIAMADDWPIFPNLVKAETPVPANFEQALNFYRDALLKITNFLGVGWADAFVYPDPSGVHSAKTISFISEDEHERELPEDISRCIEQLWSHAIDPVRWRVLSAGLSGTRVYETGDLKCLPRVMKCGSKADILSEVNRYKTYVEARLPGAPTLYGPVHWGHTYAIAYENAESRVVSSHTRRAANEYVKGMTLEEILDQVLNPNEEHWRDLLKLYTEALRRALQCLSSWKGFENEKKNYLFSLGPKLDACFRFPFGEEILKSNLQEAFRIAGNGDATMTRIAELVKSRGKTEAIRLPTEHTIHGDFHARNVYVVLSMRPGELEDVDDKTKEKARKEFHPGDAKKVANVALIDFANVTEGEVSCLDYGKYLRDLRARTISRALNKIEANDTVKLEAMESILYGTEDKLPGMPQGIFLNVLNKTIKVFDRCIGKWNHKALLYQELIFLHRLVIRKNPPWDEEKMKYCGGWETWDSAIKANVMGIQWALRAIDGTPKPVR